MIVIALRPLDPFITATRDDERRLHDTQLAFDMRASGARSKEQDVIARMVNTAAARQSENERLREAIRRKDHRRGRPTSPATNIRILAFVAVIIACA